MAAAASFKIDSGVFCLKLVDTAAVGYLPSWQAPGGKTVDTVVVADYAGTGGVSFECQTTSSALTPSSNTSDDATPATMCNPEITTTIVGVTSYTLDATICKIRTFPRDLGVPVRTGHQGGVLLPRARRWRHPARGHRPGHRVGRCHRR